MAKKKTSKSTPVEAVKHKDKRVNIPTEELRDFIAAEEDKPQVVKYPGLLYARDPSLDPQLVWKGKDQQDQEELAVPAAPIYIQEKIHPQALIENLRETARAGEPEPELTLFADFNGLEGDFDRKVDFYRHEQNWANRMILGDSLMVMTSLAEKEGLRGKVQMIYIDPPYGIQFNSNWQVSTRKRDVKDGKPEDLTRQPEQIRAFRDTWKLGIHSYLSYLRDRLVVARDLLTETGSVFVQIGDENVHLVRGLMDEVFGSENFIALIRFRKKTMPLGGKFLERMGDFLIWYAKDVLAAESKFRRPLVKQDISGDFHWQNYESPNGERTKLTQAQIRSGFCPPEGSRRFRLVSLWPASFDSNAVFPVTFRGRDWLPAEGQCWPISTPDKMQRLVRANRIESEGSYLRRVLYEDDAAYAKLTTDWMDTIGGRDQRSVIETSPEVTKRCVLATTDPGDLVVDPTCGGGTTAYVAEQWGRRWITIDTSRVQLALARTRLMSARYRYYLLADSPEGIMKEAELTGHTPPMPLPKTEGDIKKGFVYKRVMQTSLRSLANNEEIDEIHARWQEKLEPIRARLNEALKQNWEEWEIPRKPDKSWPKEALKLHEEWWKLRRERQREIDESIARRADVELLYDKPYEDSKRLRVTGPFTVESLSPHRRLGLEERRARADGRSEALPSGVAVRELGPDQFALMILDNLKKAGVQNTVRNERLTFDRLEPYPGEWIHGAGEYTDRDGAAHRVAVCIGPEFGTVGPDLVKETAKEAVKGVGFDLLIVCGFAFDPHVWEEAKRYGKLTVLMSRMNPDLSMGDELLKKTGAANLFMVFGEPDIRPVDPKTGKLMPQEDGRYVIEIHGLDVYDPTTGQIRSNSTDDIACWFIDTNYDEESFFVRHAYFTGGDEPYDRLKRALRAEIDESAWSSLYSTKSRPFDPPKTGKIAIKVINHYGDEVLKVYDTQGPAPE